MKYSFRLLVFILFFSCSTKESAKQIFKADTPIVIDGFGVDNDWNKTDWRAMDQVWIGDPVSPNDFMGKYKVLWDEKYVYILCETIDDRLMDTHADGLDRYWDDDCLELFIDENRSKGNHQFNHNAFAYHLATNLRVTDMGLDSIAAYFDGHLKSSVVTTGNKSTWEVAMRLYKDNYKFGDSPRKLNVGEYIGFMLAYCDNDGSEERENFIGSEVVEGEDKNRGWIDAGVFGEWILVE